MTVLEKAINHYLKHLKSEEYSYQKQYDFLEDKSLDIFSLLKEEPYILFREIQLFLPECFYNDIDRYKDVINRINENNHIKVGYLISFFYEKIDSFNEDDLNNFSKGNENFLSKLNILDGINALFLENDEINYDLLKDFIKDILLNETNLNTLKTIVAIMNANCFINECNLKKSNEKLKLINSHFSYISDLSDALNKNKGRLRIKVNNFIKSKNKRIKVLEDALLNINEQKAVDLDSLEKNFKENNVLLCRAIIYNNELNDKEYSTLLSEIKSQIKLNPKEEIIEKYQLPIKSEEVLVDLDVFKNKINIIDKYAKSLLNYSNILLILVNKVDYDKLIMLLEYVSNNIITEKFICNNIEKLSDRLSLLNMINNIKTLTLFEVNIKELVKKDINNDILFFNNTFIYNLLSRYKSYNIDLSKPFYRFNFLRKDYSYLIDKYIEMGEYELLNNNFQNLIGTEDYIYKRCILYKELGYALDDDGKLRSSLKTEKNFIISDKELNNTIVENANSFIPEEILEKINESNFNTIYNEVNLDFLEENRINNLTYVIGNLIVSRNKVIRIANLLCYYFKDKYSYTDLILYSIIYNQVKLLNTSDINKLRRYIDGLVKKLRKE